MSVIWGIFMNANAMFAVVFAAVVGPNGQEWYHDQFGTEGRLGRLWTVWSTGGRLVTLALIFLMIGIDITGWKNTLHEVQFGLGYNPDVFAFEAAEFLANSKEIQGNILNTSMPQGDALIWKGAPNASRTSTAGRVSSRRTCWSSGKRHARPSARTTSRHGSRCSTSTRSARS